MKTGTATGAGLGNVSTWVIVNLVHFFLISGCLMGSIDQPGNLLQRRICVGLST